MDKDCFAPIKEASLLNNIAPIAATNWTINIVAILEIREIPSVSGPNAPATVSTV